MTMNNKRVLALLMSLCLLFSLSLTACGGESGQEAPGAQASQSSNVESSAEPSAEPSEEAAGIDVGNVIADMQATLTGELTTDEARQLMQGNLDALFRNEITQDYMDLVGETEDALHDAYYEGLDVEAEVFENYFAIEYDNEEIREKIIYFYDQVYPKTDFTLGDVTRDDDGNFVCTVTIRPLNIIQLTADALSDPEGPMAEFNEIYTEEAVDAMTEEEYMEYDGEWASMILSTATKCLEEMDYLDARTTEIKVTKDSGIWSLTDESIENIDLLLIEY